MSALFFWLGIYSSVCAAWAMVCVRYAEKDSLSNDDIILIVAAILFWPILLAVYMARLSWRLVLIPIDALPSRRHKKKLHDEFWKLFHDPW